MFINAKSAMIEHGAHARQMPFRCHVEHPVAPGSGDWVSGASGLSTEYLAECWNDAKVIFGAARIVSENGDVIFRG